MNYSFASQLTVGLQPQAGRYLEWILFSSFLHFTSLPLALDHLARLVVAGMLAVGQIRIILTFLELH